MSEEILKAWLGNNKKFKKKKVKKNNNKKTNAIENLPTSLMLICGARINDLK